MTPTFALGLPHTPWRPERAESFQRLMKELGGPERLHEQGCTSAHVFDEKVPNWSWSADMWQWGAERDASHFLTLQDDAKTAPDFWAQLREIVEERPDDVIGLEVVHPAAPLLARAGVRWFSTSDCLVGVGYVVPRGILQEFLRWRATALKPGALERINEDTLLGLFCSVTGRRIYHPIPTVIDHDVSVPSTYKNDQHALRRPLVRWDNMPPLMSACPYGVDWTPHLGHMPRWNLPFLAQREVVDYSHEAFRRGMADNGWNDLEHLLANQRGPNMADSLCWFCIERPGQLASQITGVALCRQCFAEMVQSLIGGVP